MPLALVPCALYVLTTCYGCCSCPHESYRRQSPVLRRQGLRVQGGGEWGAEKGAPPRRTPGNNGGPAANTRGLHARAKRVKPDAQAPAPCGPLRIGAVKHPVGRGLSG